MSEADTLIAAGYAARRAGDIAGALTAYSEAVTILRTLPEPLRLAHTIRHVADILRESGSLESAKPRYEEALAIYRGQSKTPPLDLANTIRGYALLLEKAGEIGPVKNLWTEARSLYEISGVRVGVEECDTHLRVGG